MLEIPCLTVWIVDDIDACCAIQFQISRNSSFDNYIHGVSLTLCTNVMSSIHDWRQFLNVCNLPINCNIDQLNLLIVENCNLASFSNQKINDLSHLIYNSGSVQTIKSIVFQILPNFNSPIVDTVYLNALNVQLQYSQLNELEVAHLELNGKPQWIFNAWKYVVSYLAQFHNTDSTGLSWGNIIFDSSEDSQDDIRSISTMSTEEEELDVITDYHACSSLHKDKDRDINNDMDDLSIGEEIVVLSSPVHFHNLESEAISEELRSSMKLSPKLRNAHQNNPSWCLSCALDGLLGCKSHPHCTMLNNSR